MRKSASHRRLHSRTVDPAEQAHFAALGGDWWDPAGPFKALHAYTPVRMQFIRRALGRPLGGLRVLDIGCGGGLLSEALAKAGAIVTGCDTTAESIAAAKEHAKRHKLPIRYLTAEVAQLPPRETFDLVIASEVLEHVSDDRAFLADAAARVKPGGILVITTLNRTLPALLLGVVAAEHMLGLAPKGTHQWQKFRKPSEVAAALEPLGLVVKGISGARYNPLFNEMTLAPTATSINYLLWAHKRPSKKRI